MEKFQESLKNATQKIQLVEHLLQITYPMIKEKNILLKAIGELKKATTLTISAMLQFDYYLKEINLRKNPQTNYRTFKTKSAKKYSISQEEINSIEEIFELEKQHEQSPMEFKKGEKIVIFSETADIKTITAKRIKELEETLKKILQKAHSKMQNQYWRKI